MSSRSPNPKSRGGKEGTSGLTLQKNADAAHEKLLVLKDENSHLKSRKTELEEEVRL
jgi:hypothetical protein